MLNALVQIIQVALDYVPCGLSAVIWEGICATYARERQVITLAADHTCSDAYMYVYK